MLDFTLYDLKKEFTVIEAACLWYSTHPSKYPYFYDVQEETSRNIETMIEILLEASKNGEIKPDLLRKVTITTGKLSREGLENYAKSIGQKPAFLFPDERGKKVKGEKQEDIKNKNEGTQKGRKKFTYKERVIKAAIKLRKEEPNMAKAEMVYNHKIINAINPDKRAFQNKEKRPSDPEYKRYLGASRRTIYQYISEALNQE